MTLETRLWIVGAAVAVGVVVGAVRIRTGPSAEDRIAELEASVEATARGAAAAVAAAKDREDRAEADRAEAAAALAAARAEIRAAAEERRRERAERDAEAAAAGEARERHERDLLVRIAALEARIRALEARPAGPAPAGAPAAAPPPPAPLGPTAVRDPAHVRKVADGLNALLAKVPGTETWRIASAEAVEGDRLVDAVLEARDPAGEVRRTLRAREVRFLLDGGARTLDVRCREAAVRYAGGGKVNLQSLMDPFSVLLPVDPEPFRVSGNPLLTLR